MEIKAWLQIHCNVPAGNDMDMIVRKMEDSSIESTDSLRKVVQTCDKFLEHRLKLPLYYTVRISQELKKLYCKPLCELSTSEMILALKNSNFSHSILTAVESHELNGRKILHVDDNSWQNDFEVDKYELSALKQLLENWKTSDVDKQLIQIAGYDEFLDLDLDIESDGENYLNLDSLSCFDDQYYGIPPTITPAMAISLTADVPIQDESSGTDDSLPTLPSLDNSVVVNNDCSSYCPPTITYQYHQHQQQPTRGGKKRKRTTTEYTSTTCDDITMDKVKLILNPRIPNAQKLGVIRFFVQTIEKVSKSYVHKIYSNELMIALVAVLVTSDTQEIIETTILLIDHIVHMENNDKLKHLCQKYECILQGFMKGICNHSHYPVAIRRYLHILRNLLICDDGILPILLDLELLPLLDECFTIIGSSADSHLETFIELSHLLKDVFQILKHIPLDYVELVLPLFEKLLLLPSTNIQNQIIKAVWYICEPNDKKILELIISSTVIMNATLQSIANNRANMMRIAIVMDGMQIIAHIASTCRSSCRMLLHYQTPSIVYLLKSCLEMNIGSSVLNRRNYIAMLDAIYIIIIEMCADEASIIEEAILKSNIYDILISNVEYCCTKLTSRSSTGGMNSPGSDMVVRYFKESVKAIAVAVHGANESQIQKFISKGLLSLFHSILTLSSVTNSIEHETMKEILKAILHLLENAANVPSKSPSLPPTTTATKNPSYIYHEMIVEELMQTEYTTIHYLVMYGKEPGIVELAKTIKHIFDQHIHVHSVIE